ncbi:LysM peptidoglycan-binding domain-containing protein [Aquipuribacter sp. SD81]|uniref:LysM peptidoglycan-binding domain-containing protein n=1 Tax=Aquipuribacter sp. SD81 TaxID=3127703 RepID=UPI00301A4CCD
MSTTAAAPLRPTLHRAPGRRPALVLTRRGRVVVRALAWVATTAAAALAVLLVWVAAASFVAPGASAGDGRSGVVSGVGATSVDADAVGAVSVVVDPGDTLWSLARDHAPDRDPRAVVHDVVRLNELASSTVLAGDRLLVPTR